MPLLTNIKDTVSCGVAHIYPRYNSYSIIYPNAKLCACNKHVSCTEQEITCMNWDVLMYVAHMQSLIIVSGIRFTWFYNF